MRFLIKQKNAPFPYCNDLMSVPVAPGHVGGKVPPLYQSLGDPPLLHRSRIAPSFPCTCIPPQSGPVLRDPPASVCIQSSGPKEGLITIKRYRHLALWHNECQHRAHWGYQQGDHWSIGSLIWIVWQTRSQGRRRKQSSKIPLSWIEKFVTESVGRGCQEWLGGMKGLSDQTGPVPTLHI